MGEPIARRRRYCGLTREQVETLDMIDHAIGTFPGVNSGATWASNKDLALIREQFMGRRKLTPSAIARRIRNLQELGLIVTYYEQKIDGRFDRRTIEMTVAGLDRLELLYRAGHLGPNSKIIPEQEAV